VQMSRRAENPTIGGRTRKFAEAAPDPKGLHRFSCEGNKSVGVRTRISDRRSTVGADRFAELASALGGVLCSRPLWPGSRRYVQSESLKAREQSHWLFLTPRLRSAT
jgi:hypothetical protein